MEYEAGEYKKVVIKQYAPRTIKETAEGKYWKRFKAPIFAQQFGPVTHIDFSQQYPYHFAITSSTRVIVYDALTRQVRRTFSRFKDIAYSGSFRSDGKLIVAGGAQGIVQVFDASSRSVLRQFKGHARPVRAARFAPDKVHVLSGGDDAAVRFWDLTSGRQLLRLDGHSDYVRAAEASPANGDTWVTGAYDHTCKLWDVRSGGGATLTVDHGAPVEDVAWFPSGGLVATAGGSSVCIWDVLSGGKLLKRLSNFQKTVTCVTLSPRAGPSSSAAPRLLAGSLDGHVKVFELDAFKVTAASRYPAPVLSLGLSPDCGVLAVGMADGALCMRKHARPKATAIGGGGAGGAGARRWQARLTPANFRYFLRGRGAKAAAGDAVVAARRRANLAPYDKLLRRFRYRETLDAALATRRADVVDSVLEELAARGGLGAALGGRDAEALLPLLRHLCKYSADPRHSRLLAGVTHRLLDAYATEVHTVPQVDAKLVQLREVLMEELRLQESLAAIQGCLEPILASSMMSGLSLRAS